MSEVSRNANYSAAAHVTGWIIFFIAPLLLSPDGFQFMGDVNSLASLLTRNLLLAGLFYFNLFYLTPRFLPSRGTALFVVVLLVLVIVVSTINFGIHDTLVDSVGRPERERMHGPPPMPPGDNRMPHRAGPRLMVAGPYFSSFLITLVVASFSTLLVFWKNLIKAKEDEQERTLQKISAELSVLKLQISPHFLFNTLNNIRWLVRSKSDNAENAVMKLSQLLRYVLYQSNQKTVLLEKELEHLSDYVELQRMRLPKNDFNFTVTGAAQGKVIEPLLLIPVIENFFKHADFSKTGNRIEIMIESDRIVIETENAVLEKTNEPDLQGSGIGIENIRKRLSLNYPAKHVLAYSAHDGRFKFRLELIVS